MSIFSGIDNGFPEVREFVSRNFGPELSSVEELDGWNSRVFKIVRKNGLCPVLVKAYAADINNRAEVEFKALSFLRAGGIKEVPDPLLADIDKRICAYEYIEGRKLKSEEISGDDVEAAVSLLGKIAALSGTTKYASLPPAAESCFSIKKYDENIDIRINRLESAAGQNGKLKRFLEKKVSVFRKEVSEYIKKGSIKYGLDYEGEIPLEKRLLSPSDVGFHNILRNKDGGLYFIDFEYFGWDDPVKTVSDFILEPAVPLPEKHRKHFIESFKRMGNMDVNFKRRLSLIYPLLGLKWSLIILNDFLPGFLRKERQSSEQFNVHLENQLEKAEIKLEKTAREYRGFAELVEEVL